MLDATQPWLAQTGGTCDIQLAQAGPESSIAKLQSEVTADTTRLSEATVDDAIGCCHATIVALVPSRMLGWDFTARYLTNVPPPDRVGSRAVIP